MPKVKVIVKERNHHIRVSDETFLSLLKLKPILHEMNITPTIDNTLKLVLEKFFEHYPL